MQTTFVVLFDFHLQTQLCRDDHAAFLFVLQEPFLDGPMYVHVVKINVGMYGYEWEILNLLRRICALKLYFSAARS